MTQCDRILAMLREAGSFGVYSHVFYDAHMPRFAARVRDLRDRGYEISANPERHHGVSGVRYRLLKDLDGEVLGSPGPPSSGPQSPTSVGALTPDARREAADGDGLLFDADEFKLRRQHDQIEAA